MKVNAVSEEPEPRWNRDAVLPELQEQCGLYDDGQDEVVFLLPGCAAREFGNGPAAGEDGCERGA